MSSTLQFDARNAEPPPYWRWLLETDMELPPEDSAPLGDAIHNLRSALDHLVWGLSLQRRGKVGKWTHFPIRSDPSGMKVDGVKKTFAQLTEGQRKVIESLQPYHSRQPSTHPLSRLARLDDDDKHQALYVFEVLPLNASFEAVAIKDCEVVERIPNLGVTLKSQAEIGRIRMNATGPYPEVKVTAEFVPQIQFPDGAFVLARFQELQRFVFDEVLPRLAPDLILKFPLAEVPESTH